MPASLKLQEEYGDDLAVIFVHSQEGTEEETQAFAIDRKWYGVPALWTHERPVQVPGNGLPKFALLGSDGKLLMHGNPLAMKGDIEDAIEAQIDAAHQPPEGTPKKVGKAWSQFAKGKLGKALEELRELAAEEGEEQAAAKAALETLSGRVEARVRRIETLMEHGYYEDAEEQLDDLAKALKGDAGFEERLAALEAKLESDELEAERDAEKALSKLEKKLFDGDRDEKMAEKLEGFAADHAGTKAAERAKRLAQIARI